MKKIPKELGVLSMVDELAGGDITKHEEIMELNYIYCLNILLMRTIKNEYLEQKYKMNKQ